MSDTPDRLEFRVDLTLTEASRLLLDEIKGATTQREERADRYAMEERLKQLGVVLAEKVAAILVRDGWTRR